MAYEVQIVIARPQGPVKVAETILPDLPSRGEVVTILQTGPAPHGAIAPLQEVDYIVEQVCRAGKRMNDGLSHSALFSATLYVSLLDDQGRVIPYERGNIPGITTYPLFGMSGPAGFDDPLADGFAMADFDDPNVVRFPDANATPAPVCGVIHEYNPTRDAPNWTVSGTSTCPYPLEDGIVNRVDVSNIPLP